MSKYLIFNKPFQVLTQFTDDQGRKTLKDFIDVPDVYSAGRLDFDSEGLLILTDHGDLIHSMMGPKHKVPKEYLVQVEGVPDPADLNKLEQGLMLKDGITKRCKARVITEPDWLWARNPPIRERKTIPTTWLSITLTEGKNRQVRRMTAAIGYPTLRLIRHKIGKLRLEGLQPGEYKEINLKILEDNGINIRTKKGSSETASNQKNRPVKRSGSHPHRSQHSRNRNRKA